MRREDNERKATSAPHHETDGYEIRVKGHLDGRWATWFDGLSLILGSDGTTIVSGVGIDQAALHGLLRKVRDLGLPLVSVIRVELEEATGAAVRADTDQGCSNKETKR